MAVAESVMYVVFCFMLIRQNYRNPIGFPTKKSIFKYVRVRDQSKTEKRDNFSVKLSRHFNILTHPPQYARRLYLKTSNLKLESIYRLF